MAFSPAVVLKGRPGKMSRCVTFALITILTTQRPCDGIGKGTQQEAKEHRRTCVWNHQTGLGFPGAQNTSSIGPEPSYGPQSSALCASQLPGPVSKSQAQQALSKNFYTPSLHCLYFHCISTRITAVLVFSSWQPEKTKSAERSTKNLFIRTSY